MFGLGEVIQSLCKSLSGSIQGCLSLWVVRIASCVNFIAASAEIISKEKVGDICQQTGREVDRVWGSNTELPRGWFIGI